MDQSDSLDIYQRTNAALEHFRHQLQSARNHSSRFHTSNVAQENRKSLSQIESFVRRLLRQEEKHHPCRRLEISPARKGLNDVLLSLTCSDRERETEIVQQIVSSLEIVRNKLLMSMGELEMIDCIAEMDENTIDGTKHALAEDLETAQAHLAELVKTQEEKARRTKEDIEQDIITVQCDQNKKLNKFEQLTTQFLLRNLEWKIELERHAHVKDLSNLEHDIVEETRTIERLKTRIQLLETAQLHKASGDWEGDAMEIKESVSPSPSTVRLQDCLSGASPPRSESASFEDINVSDQCVAANAHQVTAQQTDTNFSSIVPGAASQSNPNIPPDTETPIKSQPASREITSSQRSELPIQLPTRQTLSETTNIKPCKPPHNIPVTVRIKVKEYDHNKENLSSPASTSSKESFIMAFDGLDKYARGLFANSPRSPLGNEFK